MEVPKIFNSEYRFCLILWEHEPINSTQLAKLCKEQLGWSRPTTYTVIRRLSERGVLKNENTIVSTLVTKEQVQQSEMEEMMERTFEGSVPAFIAAFANSKKLTKEDLSQLEELIKNYQVRSGCSSGSAARLRRSTAKRSWRRFSREIR